MVEMMQFIDDKTFAQSELVQAYYHEMAYGHIPMHTHNFHELNIIISGNGKHHLNGATTRITVGDLFIMPPGVPHGYDFASENFSIFHLLFHKNFFKKYESYLHSLSGYHILFNIDPQIQRQNGIVNNFLHINIAENYNLARVFNELTLLEKSQHCNTHIQKEFLAVYVIAKICEIIEREKETNDKKREYPYDMLKSIEYIHLNFSERIEPATLHAISCMSASTYLRYFKKIFNCTPMEYIQDYRLRQAKSMLKHTDHSLTTIAEDCGFWDNAHFIRLFKKKYKMSPTTYRAQLKKDNKKTV